ncbi:hypothetical protein G7054_g1351 [Neopestalotiopsis clavispora]|nr:hypothetical protein G7054_g1351 [Neopestalotiopsis clavispora]
MVQLLLDRVGDLQDALTRTGKRGALPLLITTGLGGHSEAEAIMQLLLDAGASPLLIERSFHASVDIFAGGSYSYYVERIQTLLHLGRAEAARMLAQRDSMGRTPINWLFLGEDFNPMFQNHPPLRDRALLQIKQGIQAVRAHDPKKAAINYKARDGKTTMHLATQFIFPSS